MVNSLSELFYGPIYLRGIQLSWFLLNPSLKEYLLEFTNDILPSIIITEALNNLP